MSGRWLQEARKFISTASLKQLRTKHMLSLSQCCFGNKSDHWHAVIPHINTLAQSRGREMWVEGGRGREQEITREQKKTRQSERDRSEKKRHRKKKILTKTFKTMSFFLPYTICCTISTGDSIILCFKYLSPHFYLFIHTHTPLTELSRRNYFPRGCAFSIPVMCRIRRKEWWRSPTKWEKRSCWSSTTVRTGNSVKFL